jgi:molybdopterin molybdotransferase
MYNDSALIRGRTRSGDYHGRSAVAKGARNILRSGRSDAARDLTARSSVESATAWIDEHIARLAAEEIVIADAVGRVSAQDAVAMVDLPPFDRASVDGFAVRADETTGASAYNPLSLRLAAIGDTLPPNAAVLIGAGDPLPGGADAVVPLEHVERGPLGSCEIIDAVASGSGIERKGSHFAFGDTLIRAGRRLIPHDIGLLAAAGIARVQVTRRPRVSCFLVVPTAAALGAAPASARHDASGPLLRALIERDGGAVAELREIARDCAAIRGALAAPESDVIVVAGGTGRGSDDESAAALAEAGDLAIHGVALLPGETAGLGRTDAGVPVFLLPGAPTGCLWAYELLAGRAIRCLAGRNPALPFRAREMRTARKIVSAIGTTEVCPVRFLGHDRVEPIASFAEAGLGAVARADGFVIVSEGSEGIPEAAVVTVYLHEEGDRPPIDREALRNP